MKHIEKNIKGSSDEIIYPKWHNIAAGAAAGAGSRFLTAPLDLLKIRRQLHTSSSYTGFTGTLKISSPKSVAESIKNMNVFSNMSQIMKNEGGVKGLFRGNVAATYLWIGYAAVQFSLYARTSNFLSQCQYPIVDVTNYSSSSSPFPFLSTNPPAFFQTVLHNIGSNPASNAFCSGAAAGVAATLSTYPFDICRTIFAARAVTSSSTSLSSLNAVNNAKDLMSNKSQQFIQTTGPKSLKEFAQTMYNKHGIRGFFAGSLPAVIQIIPYMGINFALYDYLIRSVNKDQEKYGKKKIDAGGAGMAGFIAGGK